MLASESIKVWPMCDGSPPVHIAGRARMLTRSLTHRCKPLISSTGCSMGISMKYHSRDSHCPWRSSFAHLTKELLRRYVEWILLQDAANDDNRMRPHDVD